MAIARSIATASALALALLVGQPALAQTPTSDAALYEAAKREGTVVWYVGGPLEGMNAIAGQFQKEFPGIKIETMRLVGIAQYQRFTDETGAHKYIADLLQNTDYPSMASLADEGNIAEWKVPTFDRIPPQFRLKDFAYAQYASTNGIIYNVNKVSPEEVAMLEKDWAAVLDPRFKNRFSVSPMKCGVCYAPIHMFMDPQFKDRYGPEFLRKIAAQKPASYSEVLVTIDRVIAGEQDFTIAGWEAAGAVKLLDGAPIRWLFPRPTPEFGNSWLGISAHAPHPNAARLFLNWLMGDRGQIAMETLYGSKGTLSRVPDQRPYVKDGWYHEPVEIYPVDWTRWDSNYHKDMDQWAAILKAGK